MRSSQVRTLAVALGLIGLALMGNSLSASVASNTAIQPTEPARTSPIVTIASGIERSVPWALRASLAEATIEGVVHDALCLEWKFGSTQSGEDFNCIATVEGSQAAQIPVVSFSTGGAGDPPMTAFFGVTPRDTKDVQLGVEGARSHPAQLVDPDTSLGLDAKFYVGFAPPGRGAVLTAHWAGAKPLWEEAIEFPEALS